MPRRERYTANWSDWSDLAGLYTSALRRSLIRSSSVDNDIAPPGRGILMPAETRDIREIIQPLPQPALITQPQKFVIVGQVSLSRHDIENNVTSVEKTMAAMVEALEGYMSVTSPVATWGLPFQIEEGHNYVDDSVNLRAGGWGYFDAPNEGHEEIIDITPKEEPYSEDEGDQPTPTPRSP